MNVSLQSAIRVPDSVIGQCSPIFKDNILIAATSDCSVLIQNTNDAYCKGFVLSSHRKEITVLCISPSKDYIFSCSEDKIVIWDISTISGDGNTYFDEYNVSHPLIVEENLGYVYHCAVNNHWLAICLEREILIFKLQLSICGSIENAINYIEINVAQSHGSMCCFSPDFEDLLISIGNSGYLCMWDINTGKAVYKTSCSSAYSVTFCKFSETMLLVGTNKGKLHLFKSQEMNIQKVLTIDVAKMFTGLKFLDSRDSERSILINQSRDNNNIVEHECIIFCAEEWPSQVKNLTSEVVDNCELTDTSLLDDILSTGRILIVCCNLGIVFYDSKSGRNLSILRTSKLLPEVTTSCAELMVLGGCRLEKIRCVIKPFLNNIFVVDLLLTLEEEHDSSVRAMPVMSLCKQSPLNKITKQFFTSKILAYAQAKQKSNVGVYSSVSSGYGKVYNRKMFQPITNASRVYRKSSQELENRIVCSTDNINDIFLSFGKDTTTVQYKKFMCNIQGKATHLAASSCGRRLACSSTSSEICVLKFLDLNSETVTLVGHDGAINSVHFSLNGNWLISASDDSCAKIWNWKQRRSVISINEHDPEEQTFRASSLKLNSQAITGARFYYVDKFIVIATGKVLKLFSYTLFDGIHDNCSYKLVSSSAMRTQRITCFTAANEFHSYIVICGCSDKSIKVYDFNHESVCMEIQDVHTSVPHAVRQVEGSRNVSHPSAMYDLIFSSAVRDTVKLWDLRTSRCVQTFSHHINRSYSNGIDISPCCQYLAVSSDDKLVYIYDTRKVSKCLETLSGVEDVIMDVKFNPCKPLLAAVGLNYNVITYSTK